MKPADLRLHTSTSLRRCSTRLTAITTAHSAIKRVRLHWFYTRSSVYSSLLSSRKRESCPLLLWRIRIRENYPYDVIAVSPGVISAWPLRLQIKSRDPPTGVSLKDVASRECLIGRDAVFLDVDPTLSRVSVTEYLLHKAGLNRKPFNPSVATLSVCFCHHKCVCVCARQPFFHGLSRRPWCMCEAGAFSLLRLLWWQRALLTLWQLPVWLQRMLTASCVFSLSAKAP